MKKSIITIIVFVIIVIFLLVILKNYNNDQKLSIDSLRLEKIKIAACPACFSVIQKLGQSQYEIVPTASTAESVMLLEKGLVDFIIAERTHKPGEPLLDYHIIEQGYSFLGETEKTIRAEDLVKYEIFTDQDPEEMKLLFPIGNVVTVDNVYEYLDKGIIVTSWENTDYTKAQIIHILENDGERLVLSRRPTLYCLSSCNDDKASALVAFLKLLTIDK